MFAIINLKILTRGLLVMLTIPQFYCYETSNQLLYQKTSESRLVGCALTVVEKFFGQEETIGVFSVEHEGEDPKSVTTFDLKKVILQEIYQLEKYTVTNIGPIGYESQIKDGEIVPQSFIVILEKGDLRYQFESIQHSFRYIIWKYRNPRARYVVWTFHDPKVPNTKLTQYLLTAAWIYEAVNTVIIVSESDTESSDIDVYGWYPNKQEQLCKKVLSEVSKFDQWSSSTGDFVKKSNLFPVKDITSMGGCTVFVFYNIIHPYVAIFGTTVFGIEVNFITEAALRSNVTVTFADTDAQFKVNPFETFIFDPALHSETADRDFFEIGELTYPHHRYKIEWLVPVGKEVPRWYGLIRIFSPTLWIFVILTFCLGLVTFWATNRFHAPRNNEMSVINSLLLMIRVHVATSVNDVPKSKLSVFLFVLWVFYCLQIYTAYQSCLIGFLANPGRYPPIKTIEQLKSSNLERCTNSYESPNFTVPWYIQPAAKPILQSNSIDILTDIVNKFLCDGEMALAAHREQIDNLLKFVPNLKCIPKYETLEETLHSTFLSMRFTKGNLLFKRFDVYHQWLQSAGILQKWYDYYILDRRKLSKVGPYALSVSHLQGAFYLLFLGVSLASVVFVIEVFIYKFLNIKHRKIRVL